MSASAENPPPVASIRPSLSVVVPQPPPPPTPRPPTPGTTTVDDGNKPVKPIMGNLVKLSKDEWVPWTGGKPNFNWTGLDTVEALGEHTSPNQLRGERMLLLLKRGTTFAALDWQLYSRRMMSYLCFPKVFGIICWTLVWTPLLIFKILNTMIG